MNIDEIHMRLPVLKSPAVEEVPFLNDDDGNAAVVAS
jgi:hypothetical protein